MRDEFDPESLAAELAEAQRSQDSVPLFTQRFLDFTWDEARSVARSRDALRATMGDEHVGYKLGWTSTAMRQALGIDQPNWGTLWASMHVGDEIQRDHHRHPKVEPELVFRSTTALAGKDVTAADVIDAGGQWAIGLEFVDPTFPTFDFKWLDNTADNSSAAAIAVGKFRTVEAPGEVEVTFAADGDSRHGRGVQAMGDPNEAVAWLIRSLAAEGASLEPGRLVFTGGLTAPFDVRAGQRLSVVAAGFDGVKVSVTGS